MAAQPRLTGKEWGLVVELLEQESDELPVEVHHTEAPQMRETLHERVALVNDLLKRLHRSFPERRRASNVGEIGKGQKRAAGRPSKPRTDCCSARPS